MKQVGPAKQPNLFKASNADANMKTSAETKVALTGTFQNRSFGASFSFGGVAEVCKNKRISALRRSSGSYRRFLLELHVSAASPQGTNSPFELGQSGSRNIRAIKPEREETKILLFWHF